MAGGGGFEPPLRGPEPRVLPLDDPPARKSLQHRGLGESTEGPSPNLSPEGRGNYLMADLRVLLGLKRGTRAGGIRIVFPVRGLVVIRACSPIIPALALCRLPTYPPGRTGGW